MRENYIGPPKWSIVTFRERVGKKNICIWGAGFLGRGIYLALKRSGICVSAFYDQELGVKGTDYDSTPIYSTDDLFTTNNSFYIVAINEDDVPAPWITELFGKNNFTHGQDFLMLGELEWLKPYVDVSGTCNLQCIACPRGNTESPMQKGGFMNSGQYRKILEKLIAEIPFMPSVRLYAFGEPFLNNELAEIVSISNEMLVGTIISSNLNVSNNLENVIKAAPHRLELSCSGYGSEHYEVTHTGGTWEKFYNNLLHLVELKNIYSPDTKIYLYYHLNKINLEDFRAIHKLCINLGINLFTTAHSVFSDIILHYLQGDKLPEGTIKSISLMEPSLNIRLTEAEKRKHENCNVIKSFPIINWDGAVQACCRFASGIIANSYLDTPIDELIIRRNKSETCSTCIANHLHSYMFDKDIPSEIIGRHLGLSSTI